MLIDTHCHLDDEKYYDDLQEVINRAFESGIVAMVIPGADINDLERASQICQKYENIYFAAGVHPYHHQQYDEYILEQFIQNPKCIAIGECGLDYYRLPDDESEKKEEKQKQQEVFRKHIALAKKHFLPLIVHIRDANDDSKNILIEENAHKVGGILHCYNASRHLLDLSQRGFYFGIGGVLTFKNAKNLVEILPHIPLEKILFETDAPYLTPHPYRGKRNEPSYTNLVAEKAAQILQIDKDVLIKQSFINAQRVFKDKIS